MKACFVATAVWLLLLLGPGVYRLETVDTDPSTMLARRHVDRSTQMTAADVRVSGRDLTLTAWFRGSRASFGDEPAASEPTVDTEVIPTVRRRKPS